MDDVEATRLVNVCSYCADSVLEGASMNVSWRSPAPPDAWKRVDQALSKMWGARSVRNSGKWSNHSTMTRSCFHA